MEAIERLREWFPQLSREIDPAIAALLEDAKPIVVPADQYVFNAGDPCQNYLLVLKGDIRVQIISTGGREATLYRIGPGGSCILTTSCILGREHYPAEAITETEVLAVAISTARFEMALEQSARFREFVFDSFASRLASVIERVEAIAFSSIVRSASL